MRFWRMHELWELAAGLSVKKVRFSDLEGFDEPRWFGGPFNMRPTPRAIAEHARDIYASDLSYPIILSPTGEVLDGWHRICKAFAGSGSRSLTPCSCPNYRLTVGESWLPARKVQIIL